MVRRFTKNNDFLISDGFDNILVEDSGCDQSVITINSFLIYQRTGVYYTMSGPFGSNDIDCTGDSLEVVNQAYTLCTTNDGQKYILGINQAFCHLDPHQNEALLAPHQCRNHGG